MRWSCRASSWRTTPGSREVLNRISAHVRTGEPIPADKQRQLIATRSFQAGLQTLRQVEFALFDMRLHAEYDPARGGRVYQILSEVRREVAVVPIPEWNRYPHSFGHIFRRWLCRRLLQLQMGRGTGGGCVRCLRRARGIRSRHRAALSRQHPVARRQPRCARMRSSNFAAASRRSRRCCEQYGIAA